jgi:poly(hydroxyalkanoate) depolymerase family esterase
MHQSPDGTCRAASNLYIRRFILKIPNGLLHATRLVRAGNLAAATEAIQRALRGDAAPPAAADDAEVIEGSFRVVAPAADVGRKAAPAARAPDPTPVSRPDRFVTRTYANAAGTREYKTYIPARFQGQPLPLVVMLHGCQQDPDDFAAGTRMNEIAEELGFIVVYPKQPGQANVSKCWNWFEAKDQQRDAGEPSIIAGLTREVIAQYGIDSRRVYIAGLSAGAAMAVIMGTTYPDLYAALGIHSGLAYGAARDVPSAFAAMRGQKAKRARRKSRRDASSRRVPTIVFHGDNDTTVHPSNGDELMAQASAAPPEANAPHGTFRGYVQSVEQGDASGRAYTRATFRDSSGKSVMEHWLVHGAAHAWFGGSSKGSFTDPHGPDASREMLRFFLQHQNS